MKAFMLFLIYTGILLFFAGILAILSSELTKTLPRILSILLLVFGTVVALGVGTFGCHFIPEVCINRTTIERIAGGDMHAYDAGAAKNFAEVFGERCLFWFLPVPPEGYGFLPPGVEIGKGLDLPWRIRNPNIIHESPQ
jgi:cytochrome b subunit of formate dehydrogenase